MMNGILFLKTAFGLFSLGVEVFDNDLILCVYEVFGNIGVGSTRFNVSRFGAVGF